MECGDLAPLFEFNVLRIYGSEKRRQVAALHTLIVVFDANPVDWKGHNCLAESIC